jgi:drug/metabolite transporter (DMT)-like permease
VARSGTRGGLAFGIVSATTFSTSGTFASALLVTGWSPIAAVTARILISALVLTVPALLALGGRWRSLLRGWPSITGYGLVAVAGCQLFYFNALQRLPVGLALLLEYLGTVLVVGWMWVRHGQRPQRLTIGGGALAIAGVALMLGVSAGAGISLMGVMWGLLAAVCVAVYFVLSAHDSDVPPVVTACGGMWLGALMLAALGAFGVVGMHARFVSVQLLGHRVSWLVPVLGLSLVASAFAYVTGILAAQRLGPRLASFVALSEVVFAVLFAWIALGQLPAAQQFAGGVLIFGGVLLVRLDEQRSSDETIPSTFSKRLTIDQEPTIVA